MDLKRGMRDKLEKYINLSSTIEIEMNINGSDKYSFFCLGVDSANVISDENYVIFSNRKSSPDNKIQYSSMGNNAKFSLNLVELPKNINKLVFAVVVEGNTAMGNINSHMFSLKQNGNSVLQFNLKGSDFSSEKAIVTVEIYMKDTWRINAVAMGFNNGLDGLVKSYGREKISLNPPPPPQDMPKKIDLRKGQKVNLVKTNNELGEILINLNWKQPKGFFSRSIDLDLGCLYELQDGSKGTVQALGNRFGSLDRPPYIALDGDDRSGASVGGENLRINGKMVSKIKRILIYTFIYDGIANWKGADGVVTVKCPNSPEIVVRMDEYGSNLTFCAIAMLENVNNTFSVEKVVNFYKGHEAADRAFNWGLRWVVARKD